MVLTMMTMMMMMFLMRMMIRKKRRRIEIRIMTPFNDEDHNDDLFDFDGMIRHL